MGIQALSSPVCLPILSQPPYARHVLIILSQSGYTNLWRLYNVRTGKYELTMKRLHEKYGPVVRIGPNLLDLDYPELSKVLYGTDGKWRKVCVPTYNEVMPSTLLTSKLLRPSSTTTTVPSSMGKLPTVCCLQCLDVLGVVADNTIDMFSTTDQTEHAQMKRPIVKHYSLGSVLALESHMDNVLGELMQQLDNRFAKGGQGTCDLGEWVAFCQFPYLPIFAFSSPFNHTQAANSSFLSRCLGPHHLGHLLQILRLHDPRSRL